MDSKKTLILAFLLLGSVLFGLNNSEIRNKILAKYSDCKTFQAEFSQYNYWPSYDKSNKSEGNIYFNSQKMILKYISPHQQYLYLHSDSLLIYNVESNQVMISEQTGLFSDFKISNIIKKYWNKNVAKVEFDGSEYKITLNLTNQDVKSITLIFTPEFVLKKMKYIDKNSNEISLSLKKLAINKKLPKNVFELKIPKDANIIVR